MGERGLRGERCSRLLTLLEWEQYQVAVANKVQLRVRWAEVAIPSSSGRGGRERLLARLAAKA